MVTSIPFKFFNLQPVIPMFTENCRDAFRTPRWGRRLFRPLYEKTRLPLCPIYGGFPVKMITHLGKPIHFTADSTPEQIKHTCRNAVCFLIPSIKITKINDKIFKKLNLNGILTHKII